MGYRYLKALHIASVLLWIGPSIGAWLVYRQAVREGLGPRAAVWLEKVVRLEHLAFLSILVTGSILLYLSDLWPPTGWLGWKLALVLGLIVPIEIADITIAHVWLPRALRAGQPEPTLRKYDRFLWYAGLPILLAAAAAFVLAVVKPAV